MLPFDSMAEEGLIGSILQKPDEILCEISGKLKPEHFHASVNSICYREILEIWKASKPIDFIILTNALRDKQLLDAVGGAAFVTGLFTILPTWRNWKKYAEIIMEKYTLRQIILVCREYGERAYEPSPEPKELLSGIASELASMSITNDEKRKTIKELACDKIDRMENQTIDPDVISTGIPSLDKNSPLRLTGMPVLAAPTKVGKTTLAINILKNVAQQELPTIYFSLEASQEEIYDLIFMSQSRIPAWKQFIGAGGMTDRDMQQATNASSDLSRLEIQIIDDVFDLSGIVACLKKWKTQNPDGVLAVIDYAQLVRGEQKQGANRENEIAGISRTFRLLAMELHIAIIVLSQLNNDGATRESRALEQDCTALWKLLRAFKDPAFKGAEPEEEEGKRLLTIPFQRKGASGIVFPVTFRGEIARIEEYAYEPENN